MTGRPARSRWPVGCGLSGNETRGAPEDRRAIGCARNRVSLRPTVRGVGSPRHHRGCVAQVDRQTRATRGAGADPRRDRIRTIARSGDSLAIRHHTDRTIDRSSYDRPRRACMRGDRIDVRIVAAATPHRRVKTAGNARPESPGGADRVTLRVRHVPPQELHIEAQAISAHEVDRVSVSATPLASQRLDLRLSPSDPMSSHWGQTLGPNRVRTPTVPTMGGPTRTIDPGVCSLRVGVPSHPCSAPGGLGAKGNTKAAS